MSIKNVYENIYHNLLIEEDVSIGLTNIGIRMANSSGKYNVSHYLGPKSSEWVYLEKIQVLFDMIANKKLKLQPMNFDRMIMEQLTQ